MIDKWLAGFITTSTFFMIKLYLDLPPESKSNFFKFGWISEILRTQFSLSTILMIVTIVIILTRIEKWYLKSKNKVIEPVTPKVPHNAFETYRRDTFGSNKTTWTWNYEWRSYEGKFIISDLKPVCRQCGTSMDIRGSHSFYVSSTDCYKCRLDGRYSQFQLTENIGDVEKEIVRRIQNNEVDLSRQA